MLEQVIARHGAVVGAALAAASAEVAAHGSAPRAVYAVTTADLLRVPGVAAPLQSLEDAAKVRRRGGMSRG